MSATRRGAMSIAVLIAVALSAGGCAASQTASAPGTPAGATPSVSTSSDATAAISSGATASSPATEPVVTAPKVKPGTIVVRGNGPTMFGPYKFKPGGYVFHFEQTPTPGDEFNDTSLVISLESKAQQFDEPYPLLCNTSAESGTNQVVVKGRLWVDVSSSANDYVLTFTPKGR